MTPQRGRGRLCFSPLGHTPGPPFFHPTARVLWFILYLFFSSRFFKSNYCLNWDFRRHAFSPEQLLNKKQKNGLVKMGGALVYVSVKRSPCAFGFCVRLVCAGCLRGKKGFCFFWPSKERNISACVALRFYGWFPAHSRGGLFTFSLMKK